MNLPARRAHSSDIAIATRGIAESAYQRLDRTEQYKSIYYLK